MYSAIDFYYICWILWSKEYTTIQALTFIYIYKMYTSFHAVD